MSSSPKPAGRVGSRAKPKRQPRRRSTARLNTAMACDAAFRVIARRCLADMIVHHEATCRGGRAALHDTRVALTRLRAAVSVFSPMIVDTEWVRLKSELKWLNSHLGAERDLDVAIELLKQSRKRTPGTASEYRSWKQKCADSHLHLARVLRSPQYRRLIKRLSHWVENGPWSKDKRVAKQRAAGVTRYGTRKLARWHQKLLHKSRRLEDMGEKKRHRLRLANKRLRYAIESFSDLLPGDSSSMHATLKHLRKAQESLGELNDAAKIQTIAATLEGKAETRGESYWLFDRKREKRLIRTAGRAYRKMAAITPRWS